MHPPVIRQAALDLLEAGYNDAEVARRLGVPRRTVRDWRVQPYGSRNVRGVCLRCWQPTTMVVFTADDYAELLGLYLGDGHVSPFPRTQRLRLMLDAKYPRIVDDAAELLARMVLDCKVGRQSVHDGRMTTIWAYFSHWSCLLPQHGPGKKHHRRIVLEPWQQRLVELAPWPFLRGCIRSDGCVFVNRTGRYAYESYDFTNLSRDVRELFVATCALVGVRCRLYERRVRIYRRESVALMLEHVGRKS